MDHLLKSSAIMIIFYVCYVIFLKRETFFVANRWFLIVGLITTVLFPMLVIPIYVEVMAPSLDGFTMIATTSQNISETFDWTLLPPWIYGIGTSFFLGRLITQLISLIVLLKNNDTKKIGHFTFMETNQNTTPFSFFRWIVYNPKQFSPKELELILKHEKVHAKQMHSLDVLLMDLVTALFWFNPVVWFYRKALKQNLEFIADRETQKQTDCEVRYQKLLLKTSVPQENLMLINTFYNSTIGFKISGKKIVLFSSFGQVKKRIVMLHKSKSNLLNSWKYTIVVPFLVIFAMTFNTKIIAQTTDDNQKIKIDEQQNILRFVVTKDTQDQQLDFMKNKLSEKGAIISFNDVARNSKEEIITIKIKYEYKNHKGNYVKKSSTPIIPIEVSINPSIDFINVAQQDSELSQTVDIQTTEDGQKALIKNVTKTFEVKDESYQIIGYKTNDENVIIKDSIFYITNSTGKVNITNPEGDDPRFKFIKKEDKKTNPFRDAENPPLIIVDGKEIAYDKLGTIETNAIASIMVLKDENATKTYGEKGKNGVLVIALKKEDFLNFKESNMNSISNNGKTPIYILDGKEITAKQMEAINPNTIESVEVLKDEKATTAYGKKGKSGVIIIKLKKE
ncbi:M56 family metallopeptidase [Gelidibacter sp.]|uniref:M56 family metallopeptidase n=1 Tax=Gelidibacter sp. TaxID=2018083 RepID=UPI0032641497